MIVVAYSAWCTHISGKVSAQIISGGDTDSALGKDKDNFFWLKSDTEFFYWRDGCLMVIPLKGSACECLFIMRLVFLST